MIENFPGSGLQTEDINFCSHNNSSGIRYIFLHHRYNHAITVTSSCFAYLFSDIRQIFLGQDSARIYDFMRIGRIVLQRFRRDIAFLC